MIFTRTTRWHCLLWDCVLTLSKNWQQRMESKLFLISYFIWKILYLCSTSALFTVYWMSIVSIDLSRKKNGQKGGLSNFMKATRSYIKTKNKWTLSENIGVFHYYKVQIRDSNCVCTSACINLNPVIEDKQFVLIRYKILYIVFLLLFVSTYITIP